MSLDTVHHTVIVNFEQDTTEKCLAVWRESQL